MARTLETITNIGLDEAIYSVQIFSAGVDGAIT